MLLTNIIEPSDVCFMMTESPAAYIYFLYETRFVLVVSFSYKIQRTFSKFFSLTIWQRDMVTSINT